MVSLFESISTTQALTLVLLDAAVKGLVLLGAAGAVMLAMRRASAAARHAMWLMLMVAMLVLPVMSAVLPAWRVLPSWLDPAGSALKEIQSPLLAPRKALAPPAEAYQPDLAAVENETILSADAAEVASPPLSTIDGAESEAFASGETEFSLMDYVLAVWAVGVLAVLAPLAAGRVALWRLARWSRRVDGGPGRCSPGEVGSWSKLLGQVSAEIGLKRAVSLLISDSRPMPMVWGIWRAKLLLPAEAEKWSDQRRRVVLLHELAHVARWDCLTKTIAQLACAFYWFNPLLWWASRRMQIEAESACDDLVLTAGSQPADYAEHLLEIASGLQANLLAAHSSIAMARRSKLEGRLLGILDGRRNRRALTRLAAVLVAAIIASIAIPLACMQATEMDERVAEADEPLMGATRLVSLCGGGVVELFAVGRLSDEGYTWWSADGTIYAKPPFTLPSWAPKDRPAGGRRTFAVAVRLHDLPGHSVAIRWKTADGEFRGQGSLMHRLMNERQEFHLAFVSIPEDAGKLQISIGVAGGNWEKVVSEGRFGGGLLGRRKEPVVFSAAHASDRGTSVTVSHNMDPQNHQVRVLALDTSGKLHESDKSRSFSAEDRLWQLTVWFHYIRRPAEVRKFRLESRPFEWVEFRTNSLETGSKVVAALLAAPLVKVVEDSPQATHSGEDAAAEKEADTQPVLIENIGECTITGRVIGLDGKPLAAAPVSLTTHVQYPNHAAKTTNHMRAITDKDGRFVIEHVPPGDHLLYYPWEGPTQGEVESGKWRAFTKPGEVYPSAPVKGILGLAPVKLSDGEKKTGITLDLSQSKCAVEGRVVDSAGKPVAKAKVALYWVAQGWSFAIANRDYPPAETDADGRYRLQGLPPGSWHLTAWLEGSQGKCKPVPVQLSTDSTASCQDLRFDTQPVLIGKIGELHQAAAGGHGDAVLKLVRQGTPVNATDENGVTALHLAAKGGHGQTVERLVELGANVNARDKSKQTPLLLAAAAGHRDVARRLLSLGADINLCDDSNSKPIDVARQGGYREMVEFLQTHAATSQDVQPATQPGDVPNFGPVIERVVNHTGENCLIDLDSGKLVTPPQEAFGKGSEIAIKWAQDNGIDAGGGAQPTIRGLIGFDIIAFPQKNEAWEKMSARTLAANRDNAFKLSKPGNPVFLSAKGGVPATYIFQTREGGVGILQILEVKENLHTRIRYKMLKQENEKTSTIQPGNKSDKEKALAMLTEYLDRYETDPDAAMRAYQFYRILNEGREPPNPQRSGLVTTKAVLAILQALKQDVVELGKSYPQLAGAKAIKATPDGWLFENDCRDMGKKGYENTGQFPIAIGLRFMTAAQFRAQVDKVEMRYPSYRWDYLGLVGWTTLHTGPDIPGALVGELQGALRKPLAKIGQLNRQALADRLPQKIQKERERLLAEADATIRKGVQDLAERYPLLKKGKSWDHLKSPSGPGRIGIYLRRQQGGKGRTDAQVPPSEAFGILVVINPPPDEIEQLVQRPLYQHLGLVGQIGVRAGEPKLDAALKKLANEALAPLKQLDEKAAAPPTP